MKKHFPLFDKPKLSVIHPIMVKSPIHKEMAFLEEQFLLKGNRMKEFFFHQTIKEFPPYLLRPFCYVT